MKCSNKGCFKVEGIKPGDKYTCPCCGKVIIAQQAIKPGSVFIPAHIRGVIYG